jgi:hypothetical protein
VNAGQHCWKACWGQPLRSSNLLSSATSDQAIHQAGHAFGLGPQGCVVSFLVSFIYVYRYKSLKTAFTVISLVRAHASGCCCGCGRSLDIPALSDQFAAVAVTMGEHLRSDSAGCSTQIADYERQAAISAAPAASHRSFITVRPHPRRRAPLRKPGLAGAIALVTFAVRGMVTGWRERRGGAPRRRWAARE